MWNAKIEKEILNEAERISNELLLNAEYDHQGISWNTIGVDNNKKTASYKFENIFSGVSGIVLFFLELYRLTQKENYLDTAAKGIRWVENFCNQNPSGFYSFFNGRLGVSYCMLRMFELSKENQYLDKALATAETCLDFFNDDRMVSNLLNGAAGTLLGLLHLHTASGEEWLLEQIDHFIKYLVENSCLGPKGIFWDRNSQNISGLCGLSHGAAGIGLAFLELGHYFGNDALYWMAEQAFLYESIHYNSEKKNWLHLRKGVNKYEDYSKHENAFMKGNMDFFTSGTYLNTWFFGAAGIGLSRVRAFEILKNPLYKQEAENAIETTIQSTITSENHSPLFILGTGAAAYAELFLESSSTLENPRYLSFAQEIALRALNHQKEHKSYSSGHRSNSEKGNTSLFMGNPGIGYFYLRIIDTRGVPSILLPKVNKTIGKHRQKRQYPYIDISLPELKKAVLGIYFSRSISLIEKISPTKTKDFFHQINPGEKDSIKNRFTDFMDNLIPLMGEKEQKPVSNIYDLELTKLRMDEAIKSYYLLFIKERIRRLRVEKQLNLENSLLDLKLVQDKDIHIKPNTWNWDLNAGLIEWMNNLHRQPGFFPLLLKPEPERILETRISPFTYVILTAFTEAKKVKEAIPDILDSFENPTGEELSAIKGKILEQIKEALLSGFLVEEMETGV